MKRLSFPIFAPLVALACVAAALCPAPVLRAASSDSPQPFGQTPAGTPVEIYTLTNQNGCEARITNYGGIVVSLKVPDRTGHLDDVVLGHDEIAGYEKHPAPYFGALIGRYGNRIAGGKFALDGHDYQLSINNAPNTLHGGKVGFDKKVWHATQTTTPDGPALELTCTSADGEEGFPGKLSVKATYTLTNDNALRLAYEATTDKPTVINLTNHSYFDLRGQSAQGDILGHEATLFASRFVPVDKTSIPLGELRPVAGTPFDFTKPAKIGARLTDPYEQLHLGPGGYDHCYVLDGYDPKAASHTEPFLAARVHDPASGRTVELWTTEPGVQFYTGNYLDGTFTGKGGKSYEKHAAFCLEPQHYPDSPNHPEWPSVVLRPGETYRNTFSYRFSVQ